jgi:hypothetical protein
MKITRKYLIGNFLVLFALTANLLSFGKSLVDDQEFSYGQDFHISEGINGGKIYGHEFALSNIESLQRAGISVGPDTVKNNFDLREGNILFVPDKPITVRAGEARVSMAAGAIVFVMQSPHGLVLYDLRQSMPNQVKVSIGKYVLSSAPGYLLVVSKGDYLDFEKLPLNCHAIVYRKAHQIPLDGVESKAFVAEYSISAGLLTIVPLRQLITSSDKQDKLVFEKIIQAAAGLDDFLGPIQPSQLANMNRQL